MPGINGPAIGLAVAPLARNPRAGTVFNHRPWSSRHISSALPTRANIPAIRTGVTKKGSIRVSVYDGLSEGEQRLLLSFRHDLVTGHAQTRGYGQRSWGRHERPRRSSQLSPKPGSYSAIISEIEQCGPELSRERAMKWARAMFPPEQVRAWLRAGLQTSDLDLIVELRALGVAPEMMGLTVRRQSMLDRIRSHGYTAGQVARTLQLERLLPSRAA